MEDYTILDCIRDLTQTDRAFLSTIRFLDSSTRNHIVAAQLRNTSQAYQLLRMHASRPPVQDQVVMNIPLGNLLDPSGSFMRNFMEPVPVVPSREEIRSGTLILSSAPPDTTCSICQENIEASHIRIRACGHPFHSQCIREWFTMNTRCPVCRHDVRDLRRDDTTTTNDNRVYSDEE